MSISNLHTRISQITYVYLKLHMYISNYTCISPPSWLIYNSPGGQGTGDLVAKTTITVNEIHNRQCRNRNFSQHFRGGSRAFEDGFLVWDACDNQWHLARFVILRALADLHGLPKLTDGNQHPAIFPCHRCKLKGKWLSCLSTTIYPGAWANLPTNHPTRYVSLFSFCGLFLRD